MGGSGFPGSLGLLLSCSGCSGAVLGTAGAEAALSLGVCLSKRQLKYQTAAFSVLWAVIPSATTL